MKQQSVALIVNSLSSGGAERVVSILANEWSKKADVKVNIVLLSEIVDFYVINENVNIVRIPFPKTKSKLVRLFLRGMSAFKFRREIKEIQPDFILSFTNRINVFSLFSLLGLNFRHFISERNSPAVKHSPLFNFVRSFLYSKSTGAILQTDKFKAYFEKNISNIPNKVISNPITCPGHEMLIRNRVIINVGRLEKQKGQELLIKAFAMTDYKKHGWKLCILGDGPLKNELLHLISVLQLESFVTLVGRQDNVFDWYYRSGMFVFSSLYEGFPNALAEAMVCGMPVISFDCPTGPSELIKNNLNGLLVEEKNIIALSNAMTYLMNDDSKRNDFSKEAIKLAAELDAESISNEYFCFCSGKIQ